MGDNYSVMQKPICMYIMRMPPHKYYTHKHMYISVISYIVAFNILI